MGTATKLSVQDEKGHQWLVLPDDPGMKTVRLVKTLGFDRQAIPFAILAGRIGLGRTVWYTAKQQATPQVATRLTAIIEALEEYVWQTTE